MLLYTNFLYWFSRKTDAKFDSLKNYYIACNTPYSHSTNRNAVYIDVLHELFCVLASLVTLFIAKTTYSLENNAALCGGCYIWVVSRAFYYLECHRLWFQNISTEKEVGLFGLFFQIHLFFELSSKSSSRKFALHHLSYRVFQYIHWRSS